MIKRMSRITFHIIMLIHLKVRSPCRMLNLFSHNFTSYEAEIIFFINSFDQQKWGCIFQILKVVGRFAKKLICFIPLGLGIKAKNQTRSGNTKNQTPLIQSFKTILK